MCQIGVVIIVTIGAFIVGFVIAADSNGGATAGLGFGIIFALVGAVCSYAVMNTIGAIQEVLYKIAVFRQLNLNRLYAKQ